MDKIYDYNLNNFEDTNTCHIKCLTEYFPVRQFQTEARGTLSEVFFMFSDLKVTRISHRTLAYMHKSFNSPSVYQRINI
jgi:hypothetical protein